MFREMRRKRQQLSEEECRQILEKGTSGVLAVLGDEGYPYAVPLSYYYDNETDGIYFHCAKTGHKLDAVRTEPKVSFCVIDQDQVVPEEYTSYFRSVIVFGKMEIMEDEGKMWEAIEKLAIKYAPEDSAANRQQAIDREWKPLCMLKLTIEYMSGKEAIELVKKRTGGKA